MLQLWPPTPYGTLLLHVNIHGTGKTFYDKKALYVQLKSLSRKQNKLRHFESQKKIYINGKGQPTL